MAESEKRLAKEKDSVEMYRLQGELRVLDCLVTLPLVVTDYLQGLTSKKYNEIVDPSKMEPRKELSNVR